MRILMTGATGLIGRELGKALAARGDTLNGIPIAWQTRIDTWDPPRRFIDLQAKGPYALWHHTHDFIPLAGGTLMRDTVRYRLPAGWLGALAGGIKVASDLERIFDYRARKIDERFGARGPRFAAAPAQTISDVPAPALPPRR